MKLIGSNATHFRGMDPTYGVRLPLGSDAGHAESQEPIPVEVRIRQYAEALPSLRPTLARSPKGRLPVGMMLDCYL